MAVYRAYRLDRRGRIATGDWLEADNDAQALEKAEALCDDNTPTVEVWQAARKVEAVRCEQDS